MSKNKHMSAQDVAEAIKQSFIKIDISDEVDQLKANVEDIDNDVDLLKTNVETVKSTFRVADNCDQARFSLWTDDTGCMQWHDKTKNQYCEIRFSPSGKISYFVNNSEKWQNHIREEHGIADVPLTANAINTVKITFSKPFTETPSVQVTYLSGFANNAGGLSQLFGYKTYIHELTTTYVTIGLGCNISTPSSTSRRILWSAVGK